jgi:SAM-dependent methyltransferase
VNWTRFRKAPWLDTRARFVARIPAGGCLLDVGSSDGETLNHFAELRPDLKFLATDLLGAPEKYPGDCQFHRGDVQRIPLPWPSASVDVVTCIHVVEHLSDLTLLFQEIGRLLKPGGEAYFETPHPKTATYSSVPDAAAGTFTMNFYDDVTHVHPVPIGALAQHARRVGLQVTRTGISRNWLFAAAWPLFFFRGASRKKFTAQGHFRGWSAYLIARRVR